MCGCDTWGYGSVVHLAELTTGLDDLKGLLQPNQFYSSIFPVSSSIYCLAGVFLIAGFFFPKAIFDWFLKKLKLVFSTLYYSPSSAPLHPQYQKFFMKIKRGQRAPTELIWFDEIANLNTVHWMKLVSIMIEGLHHELNCNVITPGNPQDRKLISESPMVHHDTIRDQK